MNADRLTIGQLATVVDRAPKTIREWEQTGRLPTQLHPRRGPGGVRFWTNQQAERILLWMDQQGLRTAKSPKNQRARSR
jgi:DNA-binding transcriptional MerR regulator